MTRHRRSTAIFAALGLVLTAVGTLNFPLAFAQSGRSKPKPAKPISGTDVKQVDLRLQKLQETFESESRAIIDGYERSGHYDRAKFLLEVLLKLDPKNEDYQKKMAELDDQQLKTTEFEFKLDAGSEWTPVGNVHKDKLTRVEASGDYKMILTAATVNPDGFPSENVMQDLVARVPTGALMGMIVTEDNQPGKQLPEAFPIKSKLEFTPKKDGVLFLKINSPPGSKCVGELKVKVGGVLRGS